MPKRATWIQESAVRFQPEENKVFTQKNEYTYDALILAPGIQLDWESIEGAKETLGKNNVSSNYLFELAPYTWEAIQRVKAGDRILFTAPNTPIKCGGAPQKALYLLSDYLRKKGILDQVEVHFYSGGTTLFAVEPYATTLHKVVARYGIRTHFRQNLIRVKGAEQIAVFKDVDGKTTEVPFQFLHMVPPQSAPDFIKSSGLGIPDAGASATGVPSASYAGWIDVDKYRLQHSRFPNIFALGDAINTPNAKTGAAVRKQAPVLVENLLSFLDGQALKATYNGYGSCPLVTGYGKLVMAEFGYENRVMETFPIDQSKERYSMYFLKKHLLPWLYWNRILPGRA
jgi:sulfide:quinone oxidoreductase